MYTTESFCEAMMLNEALFGQNREVLDLFARELGVTFDFDLRDIRLCLTGISRRNRSLLSMSRPQYQQILHPLVEELLDRAQREGLWARYAVMHYDLSKQICFLLKEQEGAKLGIREFAEEVTRRFEEEYRKLENYGDTSLANFTVLSDPVPDYDHLAGAFDELPRLKKLSFFRMETGVFDRDDLRGKPVERTALYGRVEELWEALLGEEGPLSQRVRSLFLDLIKESLDPESGQVCLYELNRMAFQAEALFCPEEPEGVWHSLSQEDYTCVEKLEEAVEGQLLTLREKILRTGNQGRTPLTLRAMGWLVRNYAGDVGLQEAAEYLGVSSAYLSRVFSRDMGKPLSAYLLGLRMERAKRLLTESDMRIGQVAEATGFRDPEYFGTLFRKNTGLSPQKYREQHQKEQRDREEAGE